MPEALTHKPMTPRSRATLTWPLWAQYALSLGAVAAALLLRWRLNPVLGDAVPYITVFSVLLLLVLLVRPAPFLVAATAGSIGAVFLFIHPRFAWTGVEAVEFLQIALLALAVAAAAFTAWLSGRAQDRRRQVEHSQQDALQQLRIVTESMAAPVARCSRDLRYLWVSRSYADMIGRTADDIVNRPIVDILGKETFSAVQTYFDRVLGGETLTYEQQIVYPSVGSRWVNPTYTPTRNAAGEIDGWVAVVLDITDRKHHEEQMRTVTAELNHRVKNTIASIDAIAQQTMRSSESLEQFGKAFSQRLRSLAAAHSLLTRTKWTGAELREIFLTELKPVLASPANLALEGPNVVIHPESALALHMAVHELTTNATKYGALSTPTGRVRVTWRIETCDGSEKRLELVWKEQYGPPVSAPRRMSYGSKLIAGVVEYELGGIVENQFEANGLRCLMSLPLEKIARAVGVDTQSDAHIGCNGERTVKYVSATAGEMARTLRVLVVEDSLPLAQSIWEILESVGSVVIGPAGTLAEAMKLAEESRFDAALLDVHLNGTKVYPLARQLHERNVPFALLTGFNTDDLPADLRNRTVLTKPIDPDALCNWLAQLAELPRQGSHEEDYRRTAAPACPLGSNSS